MFVFRRVKPVIKHNDSGQAIIDRLERFLEQESPQVVYWLRTVFEEQINAVTYAELRDAMLNGYEPQIQRWQEDYAKFVNERLSPVWASAMEAGAEQLRDKFKGFILDDSDKAIKEWVRLHTGEFITNIGEDTRAAIKAILAHGQDAGWSAQQMAYAIRPCIGLTRPDALANARYQQKVYENFLKTNSPEVAARKAHEAALRYGEKQHRARAEMIANTELAFAYNRGYHEGVRQAMAQGLMGACEKVWLTAGTNRVCDKCLALNGQRIGFDDPFNIAGKELHRGMHQTPPAHPRCRCVVQYVEYAPPIRKPQHGLASGKPYYQDEYVEVKFEGKVDFNNSQEIERRFAKFAAEKVNSTVENAIVVTKDGELFTMVGHTGGVNITAIGDKLIGAKAIHNHPDDYGFFGDAFSIEDFEKFFAYKMAILEVVSSLGRFRMSYTGEWLTEYEAFAVYDKARQQIFSEALNENRELAYIQLETMEKLAKQLTGLKFERVIP